MKIELYLVPEDIHGKALKLFLNNNNIKFNEITTEDLELLSSIAQTQLKEKISLLRIKRSHSINVIEGFDEIALNQLLDHIKKYNPKIG